jgi:RNA polymerase sigma-70 factor, ECF subfamily
MSFGPGGRHTGMEKSAFAEQVERHRRELQVHCYRMMGSLEDSEDLAQETFMRAWRRRETFEGRSSFKAWLYRIATNACLDALKRGPRSVPSSGEVPWLQPFPDRLFEQTAPSDEEPDAAVVSKETIELAFMVAIQHLPPKQRAVLILRDVLGWPAKDTAALLETSVASVNSALQRAHTRLKEHLPERRTEWAAEADPTEEERILVQRYVEATERADPRALVELMRDDARFSMPPQPGVWVGRETIMDYWVEGGAFDIENFGRWRGLATRANRQPAVACYVRRPGAPDYLPTAIDVLRIEDGAVAEIVAFEPRYFPAFELPPKL